MDRRFVSASLAMGGFAGLLGGCEALPAFAPISAAGDGDARSAVSSTDAGDASSPAPVDPAGDPAIGQPRPPVALGPAPTHRYVLDGRGLPTSFKGGEADASMWKCDPLLVDLDGDGDLDLAALPRLEPKGPRVWRNEPGPDGTRRWVDWSDGLRWSTTSCGGGLEAADVDGDGALDLVVSCHCEGIFVYRNLGESGWEPITEGLNPAVPPTVDDPEERDMYIGSEDVAVGDLDGDGHLDLGWVSSDEGGMALFFGDGTGRNWTERRPAAFPRRGWSMRIDFVDLDGDGDLDVASTFADGPRVWLNDGTGEFAPASDGLAAPTTRGIYIGQEVADMNGDGRPDLVVANWIDGPEVWIQETGPAGMQWSKRPDVFPQMFGGAVGVDAADMDGDGLTDVIVVGRLEVSRAWSRGAFVLLANGDGTYRWEPRFDLPSASLSAVGGVSTGDLNGDGIRDVVVGAGLIVESPIDDDELQPAVDPRLAVYTSRPAPAADAD